MGINLPQDNITDDEWVVCYFVANLILLNELDTVKSIIKYRLLPYLGHYSSLFKGNILRLFAICDMS